MGIENLPDILLRYRRHSSSKSALGKDQLVIASRALRGSYISELLDQYAEAARLHSSPAPSPAPFPLLHPPFLHSNSGKTTSPHLLVMHKKTSNDCLETNGTDIINTGSDDVGSSSGSVGGDSLPDLGACNSVRENCQTDVVLRVEYLNYPDKIPTLPEVICTCDWLDSLYRAYLRRIDCHGCVAAVAPLTAAISNDSDIPLSVLFSGYRERKVQAVTAGYRNFFLKPQRSRKLFKAGHKSDHAAENHEPCLSINSSSFVVDRTVEPYDRGDEARGHHDGDDGDLKAPLEDMSARFLNLMKSLDISQPQLMRDILVASMLEDIPDA